VTITHEPHDSVIFTYQLAESLAGGSVEAMKQALEELPELTSGPAKGVRRFVVRPPPARAHTALRAGERGRRPA
jgi:hypothetical protein